MDKWLPSEAYTWVKREATIHGVPEQYIAVPLIAAIGHLSEHTKVQVNQHHSEPTSTFSIVAGRSGTNKSVSLGRIASMVADIFDSGTIDGLAKSFQYVDNNRSVISINDKFSNFVESLDNGSKKSNEKSRILTL